MVELASVRVASATRRTGRAIARASMNAISAASAAVRSAAATSPSMCGRQALVVELAGRSRMKPLPLTSRAA